MFKKNVKEVKYSNAYVKIQRPELTEKEREYRTRRLKKAALDLVKGVKGFPG